MALKRVNFATAHNASQFTSARWNFQPVPDGFGNAPIQLVEIAPGNPRFAYDPATGEPEGLLIEEQRTNLVPFSIIPSNWNNASYDLSSQGELFGLPVTRITNNGAYVGNLTSTINQSLLPLSATPSLGTYTDSVIVKRVNTPSVSFGRLYGGGDSLVGVALARFDFDTESFVQTHDGATNLKAIKLPYDCWYLQATMEAGATSARFAIAPSNAGGDNQVGTVAEGDAVDILFAQREAGAFATSPIITNGTAVTRTADIVARTLGAEFNPNEGTIVVEFETFTRSGGVQAAFNFSTASSSLNSISVNLNNDYFVISYDDGIKPRVQPSPRLDLPSSSNRVKIAISWKSGQLILACVNGGAVSQGDLSGIGTPSPVRFCLGNRWGDILIKGAVYKSAIYEPRAYTPEQLQAASTL